MHRALLVVALVLAPAGCGRLGFGATGGGADADDGPRADAGDASGARVTVLDPPMPVSGNSFGYCVVLAGDGNTLAVGTIGGNGSVDVYVRENQSWVHQATLTAGAGQFGDKLGYAIAIAHDGSTLVAGAPGEDGGATTVDGPIDETKPDAGAAYVFTRAGATWTQRAYLKASNSEAGDEFGTAVALAGGAVPHALVGALREDSGDVLQPQSNTATDAGAVYVYAPSGGVWAETQYVKAATPAAGALYGSALAISEDGAQAAVGAPAETEAALPQAGAVHVLTEISFSYAEQQRLVASNVDGGDFFGQSVAVAAAGGTLAVGAAGEDGAGTGVDPPQTEGSGQSGAVYVFVRGASWTQQAYVKATDTADGDELGDTVALSGDGAVLAGGAPTRDGGGTDAGAAYTYRRTGTWATGAMLGAESARAGDLFGGSVTLSGDGATIAVGARGRGDVGAVYVFE